MMSEVRLEFHSSYMKFSFYKYQVSPYKYLVEMVENLVWDFSLLVVITVEKYLSCVTQFFS